MHVYHYIRQQDVIVKHDSVPPMQLLPCVCMTDDISNHFHDLRQVLGEKESDVKGVNVSETKVEEQSVDNMIFLSPFPPSFPCSVC